MNSYQILGFTNPIGSECSPLITIIKDKKNKVLAQFPDSTIKLLAFRKGETFKDIKGIILAKENLSIDENEYSYLDHSQQIHICTAEKMLEIIKKDMEILKTNDEEIYEMLRFFFLQEQEALSLKSNSTRNENQDDSDIISVLVTKKKSKKHKIHIIKRPIISEKSERLSDDTNYPKYTFEVDKRANKIEIGKAIELFFGVSVKKVNTLNTSSKNIIRSTRNGHATGRKSGIKKAIVTLDFGQNIDFYGLNINKKIA